MCGMKLLSNCSGSALIYFKTFKKSQNYILKFFFTQLYSKYIDYFTQDTKIKSLGNSLLT